MAKFLEREKFINENVALLSKRISNQYSTFLESRPTFVTYYHINTKLSTVDKGSKDVEALLDSNSPTRYNRIESFPIYGIEQMELQLQEDEHGLDIDYDGECIILPNTVAPTPDDYFHISYLGRKYLFRLTHVTYDTIKSNSFYKAQFSLKATSEKYADKIDKLVVEKYHCIFDNIGTDDKCIIRDELYDVLVNLTKLCKTLRDSYIEKYYDKRYNALMFMRSGELYLYDSLLNVFVNKSLVFDLDVHETETYLFYEELRPYFGVAFEQSLYDRVLNKDLSDLKDINIYYDMELAQSTESIFDYYRDKRVKYMAYYPEEIGPYGNHLTEYIPKNFITALDFRNKALLTDPYEIFLYTYMMEDPKNLLALIDTIDKRRISYTFLTYIFLPLVLYALRQLCKEIVVNNSIIDEAILNHED